MQFLCGAWGDSGVRLLVGFWRQGRAELTSVYNPRDSQFWGRRGLLDFFESLGGGEGNLWTLFS